MKQKSCFYIICLLLSLLLFSCTSICSKKIDVAYSLVDTNPDSAITILKTCNRYSLSDAELARYSLCYYKAQDKSGYDVDRDTLIRIAYDYYSDNIGDSLYATSQYYMGRYFSLVDSTEKAKICFLNAFKIAEQQQDSVLFCIASQQISLILRLFKPQEAIDYARKSLDIYSQLNHRTIENLVYCKLHLAECYSYVDSLQQALELCHCALKDCDEVNNKELKSNVCQDIACMFQDLHQHDSALYYAKQAYELSANADNSLKLSLAISYNNVNMLQQSKNCLATIPLSELSASMKSSVYYCYQAIAIEEKDFNAAQKYSDSIYVCMSQILSETAKEKDEYYANILKQERENNKIKNSSRLRMIVFSSVGCIFVILVCFILYIIWTRVKITKKKHLFEMKEMELSCQYEKELRKKEKEIQSKLHAEQIAQKEKQIILMHQYLMQKVSVAQKINKWKTEEKKILLNDDDWKDIKELLEIIDNHFFSRLSNQYTELSEKDIRLMLLLRLGISSKQLALIYGISEKSVKQKLYILKQKVGIDGEKISLREFILSF